MKLLLYLHGEVISETALDPSREYQIGRADGNDIQLQKFQGISRKHFRLFNDGQAWRVEVLSKVENIFVNGQPVGETLIQNNSQFTLGPYLFSFVEEVSLESDNADAGQALEIENVEPGPASSEENTQIGKSLGMPFVRVYSEALRIDTTLRLEGHLWVSGRDKSCAIVLEDAHSSRRHFEITQTPKGFFLTDLGSANGTLLNGVNLQPNQPVRLHSGDVITVSQTQIHFELRDPEFQKKLQLVPQDILAQQTHEVPMVIDSMEQSPMVIHGEGEQNLPAEYSPEYAQQMAAYQAYYQQYAQAAQQKQDFWKKNRLRLIIAALIVGAGAVYFAQQGDKNKQTKTVAEGKVGDPFNLLPPDQQALVKDSYQLAKSLITHRKYVMAQEELNKISQILPNGYRDSVQLVNEAKRAIQVRADAEELERLRKEKEEMQKKVNEIVAQCRTKIRPETTAEEITNCIQPALELDPENADLKGLQAQVEAAQAMQLKQKEQKSEYQKKVAQLEALCRKAEQVFSSGDLIAARVSYRNCIESQLPDPKKLKEEAKRKVASIDGEVKTRTTASLSVAEQAFSKQDYKTAVAELKKVRKIDPKNPSALNLQDRIEAETNNKMKNLYSDSILEESYGQIELAKEKWQKIIDMGLLDSDYYKRAKRKLQRYGVM